MAETPPALAWRNRLKASENDETSRYPEQTDTQSSTGSRNRSIANLRQKE